MSIVNPVPHPRDAEVSVLKELVLAAREYRAEFKGPAKCFIHECRACARGNDIVQRLEAAIARAEKQL